MKTIAFVTQKGGVGKTTLAANLAIAATESGEKVIAIDLDPQGSLLAWGNDRDAEAPVVDTIPPDKIARLSDVLASLSKQGFTVAILDTPGIASTATNLAMKAADINIIPSRPAILDLRATKPTVEALVSLKRPFAFLLNQCPPRSGRSSEAAAGLTMLGIMAEPYITQRADFQDAVASGQGVTEYAPSSKAAEEIRQLWGWISKQTKGK